LGGLKRGEYTPLIPTGDTYTILYVAQVLPKTLQKLPKTGKKLESEGSHLVTFVGTIDETYIGRSLNFIAPNGGLNLNPEEGPPSFAFTLKEKPGKSFEISLVTAEKYGLVYKEEGAYGIVHVKTTESKGWEIWFIGEVKGDSEVEVLSVVKIEK
jgi:hypothetical protein